MDATPSLTTIEAQIAALPWDRIEVDLDDHGAALIPHMLEPETCAAVAGWYDDARLFRSRVVMARHGFGRGEYRYFAYPLPTLVQALRASLYPRLAPVADRWHARLGLDARFPPTLDGQLDRCRLAGQSRPTPLLLRYGEGDHNCLHQDV